MTNVIRIISRLKYLKSPLFSGEGIHYCSIAYLAGIDMVREMATVLVGRHIGVAQSTLEMPGSISAHNDEIIWQLRPCVGELDDMALRQLVLRTLATAVEANEPGAVISELDDFSFFAFRSAERDQVLAEMGINEILPS